MWWFWALRACSTPRGGSSTFRSALFTNGELHLHVPCRGYKRVIHVDDTEHACGSVQLAALARPARDCARSGADPGPTPPHTHLGSIGRWASHPWRAATRYPASLQVGSVRGGAARRSVGEPNRRCPPLLGRLIPRERVSGGLRRSIALDPRSAPGERQVRAGRQHPGMDDLRFGTVIRTARTKRGWRQSDLARRAGVSQASIWRAERGGIAAMNVATIRRICAPLEIRVELLARGRGADFDRMLSARHSALHESVARMLAKEYPQWTMASEVSFAIRGEWGVIDILLWHPERRALVIVEFKTELVDVGDLLGTMDRRHRLASEIAEMRGWHPRTISTWVILAASRTNERRVAEHRVVLRNAFPADGRRMHRWLSDPEGPISALSLWSEPKQTPIAMVRRVQRAKGRSLR
jgi:transcriptional regulator with XRE-family HTH domain